MKTIILFVLVACMMVSSLPGVYAHACDCNAGGVENRVCLYTEPASVHLEGGTFDFDIKMRNYYRGGTVSGLSTFVQSCRKQDGGYCTFSESGDTDFWITVEPGSILSIRSGSGPIDFLANYGPDECRKLGFGQVSTVNAKIAINNAAEGTYTVRFRVTWQPHELARYVDVTFSLESGDCHDECSAGEMECVGSTHYRVCDTSGACSRWGETQSCAVAQICSSGNCVATFSHNRSTIGSCVSWHGIAWLLVILSCITGAVWWLTRNKKLFK